MVTQKKIILIGGGGHCKSCIDVIENQSEFMVAGIVDIKQKFQQKVLGYPIIGDDDDLKKLAAKFRYFCISIGSIKNVSIRSAKFDMLKKLGAAFPVIISPLAHVAKSAVVGEGTVVMHQAVINAAAKVGVNCIVNTGAIVEHDVTVGDHVHISTGSVINGSAVIGNRVFVGSNCVIFDGVKIASGVILGAGAVVTKSIAKPGVYFGNPARKKC